MRTTGIKSELFVGRRPKMRVRFLLNDEQYPTDEVEKKPDEPLTVPAKKESAPIIEQPIPAPVATEAEYKPRMRR